MDPGRDFKAGERASRGARRRRRRRRRERAAGTAGGGSARSTLLKQPRLATTSKGSRSPVLPVRGARVCGLWGQSGGWGRLWPGLAGRKEGGCLLGPASLCQIPILGALKDAALFTSLARSSRVRIARGSGSWGALAQI